MLTIIRPDFPPPHPLAHPLLTPYPLVSYCIGPARIGRRLIARVRHARDGSEGELSGCGVCGCDGIERGRHGRCYVRGRAGVRVVD